ncbi:VCBS repeat-containing protein [uncultured Psychroserpens sp.]|uniref:FG-GAP repeat domain-containing protein n=1 Tax=uncultured Psychroserpens sp. TaxID=255436 RepID=UPI002629E08F|nr:VCBS repeat-containing protein [uncultured Psychroserpens sp.]
MKAKIYIVVLLLISITLNAQKLEEVTFTHLPQAAKLPYNSMDANVADIDNDGDLDIVVAIEFYKNLILINDGKGHFSDGSYMLPDKIAKQTTKPYQYYPYHDSEDVAIKDIDNNGKLDILFITEDDKINELYLQNESNKFIDASDKFPVKGISNALMVSDFDNDGWKDCIIGNNGQNYYLKNEKGTLVDETETRLPAISDVTQDLEVGDYDNDGDLDILVGNEDDNRLLINDGKGYFKDITHQVFSSGISEETREADFADVDNDGDLDIYFANVKMFTQKEPIQRLLINENGKYIDKSKDLLHFKNTIAAVDADFFDLDNDGDLDLLLGKMDGFSIGINDGKGNFKEHTEQFIKYPINGLIVDIEVADFNQDNKPDIYLACFGINDKLFLSK